MSSSSGWAESLTRPRHSGHLKVAAPAPHVQLIQAFVLCLVRADILSDQCLVSPYGGHKVSPRPGTLPYVIVEALRLV